MPELTRLVIMSGFIGLLVRGFCMVALLGFIGSDLNSIAKSLKDLTAAMTAISMSCETDKDRKAS